MEKSDTLALSSNGPRRAHTGMQCTRYNCKSNPFKYCSGCRLHDAFMICMRWHATEWRRAIEWHGHDICGDTYIHAMIASIEGKNANCTAAKNSCQQSHHHIISSITSSSSSSSRNWLKSTVTMRHSFANEDLCMSMCTVHSLIRRSLPASLPFVAAAQQQSIHRWGR